MQDSDWNSVGFYLLSVVGLYASLIYLYESLDSPIRIIWSVLFPTVGFKDRYGPWAVITGSSDGIGKQYALNLAREGMNLVLISRTKSKLQKVSKEIESECNVEVRTIVIDFSEGSRVYDKIRKELEGLDVGILVNNVGVVHSHPATADEMGHSEIQQAFDVNMLPTVMMVQMLLPGMKQRRRGIIVNVSSGAGYCPVPYLALYGATKAFLSSYSQALQEELLGSGVECQLVAPLLVATNLIAHVQHRLFVKLMSVNVQSFGRSVVWLIGKTHYTTGCWKHAVQATAMRIMPVWLISKVPKCYLLRIKGDMMKTS